MFMSQMTFCVIGYFACAGIIQLWVVLFIAKCLKDEV